MENTRATPHLLSLGEAGRGLISPHRSMHPLRPLMPPASRCHKMCNQPCVGIPPMSNQHNRFITSIRSPLCPFVPSFASFVVYTQPRSFYPLTFVPFAFYTPHTYNFAHPKICLIFVNPSSDKPHLLSLGEAGRGLISPHRSMHPLRPLMPPASRCHKMCNQPCVGIPPMSNQHNRFITSIRSPLCPFVPSFASFVVYTQPRSFYPLTFVPFAFYTPHTYNFAHPKICLIFVNPSSDKPHLLSLGGAGERYSDNLLFHREDATLNREVISQ